MLDWQGDTLVIPRLIQTMDNNYILNGEEFRLIGSGNVYFVTIPKEKRNPLNTILVFKVAQPASKIEVKKAIYFKDITSISLSSPPHNKYSAEGKISLVNKKFGKKTNLFENWFGF